MNFIGTIVLNILKRQEFFWSLFCVKNFNLTCKTINKAFTNLFFNIY